MGRREPRAQLGAGWVAVRAGNRNEATGSGAFSVPASDSSRFEPHFLEEESGGR